MCQHIVFGMDCGTRKLDMMSDTGVLWKKSLFYGQVEAYFAVYDSVVLTGPNCVTKEVVEAARECLIISTT